MIDFHFTPITTLLLFGSSILAGILGALVGIGGGIIIVPMLTLAFGLDIKYAVATSLVAVVASSTASGSVYVGKGLTNMRLAMILEIATTIGGIIGGLIAVYISANTISGLFALIMLFVAFLVFKNNDKKKQPSTPTTSQNTKTEGQEDIGKLAGSYYDPAIKNTISYQVKNVPLGGCISFVAGILSGLLGVGGGFIKVPAMTLGMNVPIKVATATSNFMIGITAISSLFIYFSYGYIIPMVAVPVALGIVCGALYGTTISQKISPHMLKKIFAVLLVIISIQMVLKFLGVEIGK